MTNETTYFVISLDSTMRLSSFTTRGPTHTESNKAHKVNQCMVRVKMMLTLFENKTVIVVVRVVCITKAAMRVLRLQKLVAVFARMSSTKKKVGSISINVPKKHAY